MSAICRNCGSSLSPGDAFCGNCGQPPVADEPTEAATSAWIHDDTDFAAPMPGVGDAPASSGPPESDAQIDAAGAAPPPRAFPGRADSLTDQGAGQGRPDDAGRAAYKAQGQPQYRSQHGQAAGHPGQVTAGYPDPAVQAASSKSFIGSLFDFGFTSFVTPTVVKVLYVLIVIVLGVSGLGFAVTAFLVNKILGIFVLVVVAPLIFIISLALYRIVLELFIVIFRIAEDLRAIRNRGSLP